MAITITWYGHSAFALDVNGHPVLIDPFLSDNPLAPISADEARAELILLSHGHSDHSSDVVAIAQRTGAPVISNVEISNWLKRQGVSDTYGQNTGGAGDYGFMEVKLTIAFHSSSLPDGTYGGSPNGFLITAAGKKIYYAGDTALFGDMALYGEEGIDLAILPIGDYFTMGVDDSIRGIKLINPRFVMPMHYNTSPTIAQDVAGWANRVNSETDAMPIVLDPGGTYPLP